MSEREIMICTTRSSMPRKMRMRRAVMACNDDDDTHLLSLRAAQTGAYQQLLAIRDNPLVQSRE